MKEATCKKLQEIGAFALAGGCTRKRMNQLVEMIRAARDYRWVGVYKIIKDEFVILAETGKDPATYPRFPITQGLCGAALDSGKPVIVGDVSKDIRYLPTFIPLVPRSLCRCATITGTFSGCSTRRAIN